MHCQQLSQNEDDVMRVVEIRNPEQSSETSESALDSQLVRFLSRLWRGGSHAYYWNCESKESLWFSVDSVPEIPRDWRNNNIFFGVHPTDAIPTHNAQGKQVRHENARSRKDNIAAVNCLYADFDAKDEDISRIASSDLDGLPGSSNCIDRTSPLVDDQLDVDLQALKKQQALDRIAQLDLHPSCIIDSGGGYHCYWLLSDPIVLTEGSRKELARLQSEWVGFVGSDKAARDLARLLRMPGTHNRKQQYTPDYPYVSFIHFDEECTYCLEDFERFIPEHGGSVIVKPSVQGPSRVSYGDSLDETSKARVNLERLKPGRADDYNSWIQVGMSLTDLGDEGLQLWDQWSAQSAKYVPGECGQKWVSFGANGGLGLGSLVFWANEDDPNLDRISQVQSTRQHDNVQGDSQIMMIQNTVDNALAAVTPDVIRYRPEDGGILDSWYEKYSTEWVYSSGLSSWLKWMDTHWEIDPTQGLKKQVLEMSDLLNQQAHVYLQYALRSGNGEHKRRAGQWINATKRNGNRICQRRV